MIAFRRRDVAELNVLARSLMESHSADSRTRPIESPSHSGQASYTPSSRAVLQHGTRRNLHVPLRLLQLRYVRCTFDRLPSGAADHRNGPELGLVEQRSVVRSEDPSAEDAQDRVSDGGR
jgi:hypothetical protein